MSRLFPFPYIPLIPFSNSSLRNLTAKLDWRLSHQKVTITSHALFVKGWVANLGPRKAKLSGSCKKWKGVAPKCSCIISSVALLVGNTHTIIHRIIPNWTSVHFMPRVHFMPPVVASGICTFCRRRMIWSNSPASGGAIRLRYMFGKPSWFFYGRYSDNHCSRK